MIRIVMMIAFFVISVFSIAMWLKTFDWYRTLHQNWANEIIEYFDNIDEMELLKKINFTYYTKLSDKMDEYSIFKKAKNYNKKNVNYDYLRGTILEEKEYKEKAEKIEQERINKEKKRKEDKSKQNKKENWKKDDKNKK